MFQLFYHFKILTVKLNIYIILNYALKRKINEVNLAARYQKFDKYFSRYIMSEKNLGHPCIFALLCIPEN